MKEYSNEQIEAMLKAEIEHVESTSFQETLFRELPELVTKIRKKLEMMSVTYAEDQIDLPTLVKGVIKDRTVNILARNSYKGYIRLMEKQGKKPSSFKKFIPKTIAGTASVRDKFDRIQQQGIEIGSIVFSYDRGEPMEVIGITYNCGLTCRYFSGKLACTDTTPFYFQSISIEEAMQLLRKR